MSAKKAALAASIGGAIKSVKAAVAPVTTPKQPLTPASSAIAALAFSEIEKMDVTQAVTCIQEQQMRNIASYVTTAKVILRLDSMDLSGLTVGEILRDAGVKKSTVDNARYAARVFRDFVQPGHMEESLFDTLSFGLCFRICRVTSEKSKLRLSALSVVALLKDSSRADEEMDCLYEYGIDLETKATQEKAAKEAEAKKAEQEKQAQIQAEAAKLVQSGAVTAAAAPAPEAAPAPSMTAANPGVVTPAATVAPAPVETATAPVQSAAQAVPTNVIAMPVPSPDAKAEDIIKAADLLAELFAEVSSKHPEEAEKAFPHL